MKLVLYTPESFKAPAKVSRPTFTVTKGSVLKISKMLADSLGLKAGDKVMIAQDEKSPTDWFVGVTGNGFQLKQAGTDASLQFSCKQLAQILRDQFPKASPPIRIPVSPEPTDIDGQPYFALITRLLEKK
jgi:hypothetical protein